MSESFPTDHQPQPKVSNSNNTHCQLQGYLLKHSVRNPLVPSAIANPSVSTTINASNALIFRKKRWFLFNEQNGKLYYYRNREDLFPIGEVDICSSSFMIKPSNSCSSFQFEIRSGNKNLVLEASTVADGFNWVRTLQQYRHNYFNQYLGISDCDQFNQTKPTDKTYFSKSESNINQVDQSGIIDLVSASKSSKYSDKSEYLLDYPPKSKRQICFQEQRTQSFPPLSNCLSSSPPQSETKASSNSKNSNAKDPMNQSANKTRLFGNFVNRMRTPSSSSQECNDQSSQAVHSQSNCCRCKRLEESLITLNHDKFALEDEVKTNRDVIKILQEQLRIFNSEKQELSDNSLDDGKLSAEDLIGLRIKCNYLENENKKLKDDNKSLEATKQVLEEMLESRDRTLVSLTHEVYDLESKNSRMLTRAELEREFLQDEMPQKIQQRIEQLEDTVVAFEQQNEFLNKEIIELNEIRYILENKQKQSDSKLCEVEAKCSQIQSKLLSLLKEIHQCIQEEEKSKKQEFHNLESAKSDDVSSSSPSSFVTNESVKNLVNRLMEESSLDIPLSWKPGNRPRNGWISIDSTFSVPEYDELGFYQNNDNVRCYDVVLEPDKNEISWRSKWDHFMSNLANHSEPLTGNFELKHMLRMGVPHDYRCKIWRMLIHQRVKDKKDKLAPDYYESLLRNCHNPISSPTRIHQGKVLDPSAKQIELDLLRTLPNNRHFENLESDGIERLRRVLIAYSLHNGAVGYCQGLNRLAAVALLFMPEEDAFWCLVAIVEYIMPKDYFGRNLMGAHVDQYVLRDLITDKLPHLSQHMEQYQIEISLFAWFLTIFVDNIPVSVYLHIWDVFLHEGSKVLFRFALAILRIHEAELLQLNDSASVNQFLRTLEERQFNLRRLSEIAFRELNPFPSRLVRHKRTHYTILVTEELKKIDEFRQNLTKNKCNELEQSNHSQVTETGERTFSFDENESD